MGVIRLDRVEARNRLKPRREPYWHRVAAGCYLGYRKMTPESAGAWLVRSRDPATGRQIHRALGEFSDLPAHERFDIANRAAREWFEHLGRGGATDVVTVKSACERYVERVRDQKGATAANDLSSRLKRWVYADPIGKIELPKLTKTHVEGWRKRLAGTPVRINPHSDTPKMRPRTAGSVNRDLTALRACLNFAHDAGYVTSDTAWRVPLRPVDNADGRRDLYLDRDQRRALLANAPVDLAAFLQALMLVPLRPGALAGLTAKHFDARLAVLAIGKDKAGADRRIKLPKDTAAFFVRCIEGKPATAPLLTRADGKAWHKDSWKKPFKRAAIAAALPEAATVYTLRHSVITDLVIGGLDLLTTARLSGTSVAMIEKHYGHLRAEHAAVALASLAL